MNAYRLYQIIALRRLVTHMTDESEPDFSAAMAYGKKREIAAGDVIFSKGDAVDSLYYLAEGLVEIEGQQVTVSPGKIFGEMAFFNSSAERSATVRCVEDTVVYELNEKRFTRLQYEDPKFAMSVMPQASAVMTGDVLSPVQSQCGASSQWSPKVAWDISGNEKEIILRHNACDDVAPGSLWHESIQPAPSFGS